MVRIKYKRKAIKLRIIAGSSVRDGDGRDWIWDRCHNYIGYFLADMSIFHIVDKYSEGSFLGLDLYIQNKAIFITSQVKTEILKYDIENQKFYMYKAQLPQEASQYYSARLNQTKIIMIAYELKYPAVVFDMSSGNFEEVYWLNDSTYTEDIISRIEDSNDEIMIPVATRSDIFFIDKRNLQYSKVQLQTMNKIGVAYKNDINEIWAVSSNGNKIIKYSEGKECEIILSKENIENLFSKLIKCGGLIIAIPRYGENIYLYSEKQKEVRAIRLPLDVDLPEGNYSLFWNCIQKNDKLFFLPWRYPQVVEMDLKTYELKNYSVSAQFSEPYRYINIEMSVENDEIELQCLIEYIKRSKSQQEINDVIQQIGKKINDEISSEGKIVTN